MFQVANTRDEHGAIDLVWGAGDIGRVIKRSTRQVNHMLASGALPGAKKIGNRWVISRRALLAAFEAPISTLVKS